MGSRGRLLALAAAAAALSLPAPASALPRIYHDSFSPAYRSPAGAVPGGTRVTLRVRAAGAKAVSLRLVGLRPAAIPMRRSGAVWSATLRTPRAARLVGYSFRVRLPGRVRWYGDDFGDANDDVRQGGRGVVTRVEAQPYQLTVYDPAFRTPSWLRDSVVYELFVDRFRNGDPSNDYCRVGGVSGCPLFYGSAQARLHPAWNERVEDPGQSGVFNRDFFGGDLDGIRQELGYLQALGVGAIWTTPIFKARSNHRYDTDDYLEADPGVGGDAAFSALAAAAGARGIRLILDGVFNHASSDGRYFDKYHRYATDGACESLASPWRRWFSFANSTIPCDDYASFFSLDTLPQLNHRNVAVRDFVESVVRRWDAAGAGGWRLDAADSVQDGSFWPDFRRRAKLAAADAPLIGEIWPDASAYLLGDQFDGVMDYRFARAADGFVRRTSFTGSNLPIVALGPSQLDAALHAIREDYPPQALASSFELIDSHDTVRALYLVREPADSLAVAKERQRLAALLQFTYVGVPMVYYGDEVGIDAPGPDPFDRPPFPWTDAGGDPSVYGPPDGTMLAYYESLGRIRRKFAALRRGGFRALLRADAAGVYAFARSGGADEPVVVALNKRDAGAQVSIPVRGLFADGQQVIDQLSTRRVDVDGGAIALSLPPRTGAVLAAR